MPDFWDDIDGEDTQTTTKGPPVFPEGTYVGKVEKPPFDPLTTWEASDRGPEAEQLTVQFGDCVPQDPASGPCGGLKHRIRITTKRAGTPCWSFQERADDGQLRMGFVFLTRLATALGVRDPGETAYNAKQFIEMLETGTFEGSKVQFRTYHTPKKSGDGVWVNTAPKSIKAG